MTQIRTVKGDDTLIRRCKSWRILDQQGVTFPAMNFMLATWIPLLERSKFSSLVYAGK